MSCAAASLGSEAVIAVSFLPGTDPFLDAGEVSFSRDLCQTGPDGIEVYIGHARRDSRIVEQRPAFEPR